MEDANGTKAAGVQVVKIASESWEFEQIHRLNHQTFAGEIPQHPQHESGRLVDRFHDENTYVIGLVDRRLAGMVAIRDRRPFSLDGKLPNLESYLPAGRSMCELRLLAVVKSKRRGRLLTALFDLVWQHCLRQGYDLCLISGVTSQLKLYRHLGFEPFGPLLGEAPAQFQPMMVTLERFAPRAARLFRSSAPTRQAAANFLPGPVTVHEAVTCALGRPPESHRSNGFLTDLDAVKTRLRHLVSAERVEILLGSGTTANDVIAGQLSQERTSGAILTNGEFGERLVDHGRRWGLTFDVLARPWGKPFDQAGVRRILERSPAPGWLWFVHCETSTGMMNDLEALRAIATAAGVKVCVDAISSIGTAPVNLQGIYLASSVSSKGLGAVPGVAMVFYDHDVAVAPRLPRILDLGLYARDRGVPFTHSSNLVGALHTALQRVDWDARFRELASTGVWLRTLLTRLGFELVGSAAPAPAIVTIALPPAVNSLDVCTALERQGYLVSAKSRYLLERNWVQLCLMSESDRARLFAVSTTLHQLCGDLSSTAATLRC